MSKIWLTSDTHYSHTNSLRYCGRPFWTKEQMDKAMIERWNKVVSDEDLVIHMGDVAMHTKPMLRILPQLKGEKWLVIGNHDMIFHYFLKSRGQKFIDKMMQDYIKAGFTRIIEGSLILDYLPGNAKMSEGYYTSDITKVRLCHFPTKNAFDNYHSDRHDSVRPEDTGILNASGHIHQLWKKQGNNINVGVDVWDFTPVDMDTVVNLWKTGPHYIPTPKRWRINLWKFIHTMIFYACKPFKKLLK